MHRDFALGCVYMALATFIFSTMEVVLKVPAVAGVFHPIQLTMERFILGGVGLIPVAAWTMKKKGLRLTWGDLAWFSLTGFLNICLGMVLYQMAILIGQANIVAVIFCSNPIFTTFLAFFILHETIRWNNILALVFELLGILAIVDIFGGAEVSLLSVCLTLLAALLFALYSVLGKKRAPRVGSIAVTSCSFILGGLELLVLILLGYTAPGMALYRAMGLESLFCQVPFSQGFSAESLPWFLFISFVNCAAGYVFHMLAIEKTSAIHASLIFFFKPILAPLIALAVLGEAITSNIVLGILMFLIGSLLGFIPALWRHHRAAPVPEKK